MTRALPILLLLFLASPALAQTQYELDPSGHWVAKAGPAEATDADTATINKARELLADNKPGRAKSILTDWLEEHETGDHPLLPQAYLLRGDAVMAGGNEFEALYDYEQVCREYPGSEEFLKALDREYEIADKYIHGFKRKWLGMRLTGATDIGEELLVRIQERLPGSRLAEKAALELADYYYRERDLKMAADAYEIFATNFPKSESVGLAKQRRIYANIARFQGPDYDASTLTDARVLIEQYSKEDPAAARKAGLSDALVARLDESGGAQVLEKAKWYLRRSDLVSARFVLQRVIEKHPQTVAARTALKMLEEHGWPAAAPKPPAEVPEPAKPEPTKPDPTKPEPTKPEPTKPEPTKPDPTKPDPTP